MRKSAYTTRVNEMLKREPYRAEDVDAIREAAKLFGRVMWTAAHGTKEETDALASEMADCLICFAERIS